MGEGSDENDPFEEDIVFDQAGLLNARNNQMTHHTANPPTFMLFIRTVFLCVAFLGLGLCTSISGGPLIHLEIAIGVTSQLALHSFTSHCVGMLIGGILGSFLFEKFNRQFLICISLIWMSVSISVLPFTIPVSYWWTSINMAALGMGLAFLFTGSNVLCLDLWGKQGGASLQALHFSFALGALIAPLFVHPFLAPTYEVGFGEEFGDIPSNSVVHHSERSLNGIDSFVSDLMVDEDRISIDNINLTDDSGFKVKIGEGNSSLQKKSSDLKLANFKSFGGDKPDDIDAGSTNSGDLPPKIHKSKPSITGALSNDDVSKWDRKKPTQIPISESTVLNSMDTESTVSSTVASVEITSDHFSSEGKTEFDKEETTTKLSLEETSTDPARSAVESTVDKVAEKRVYTFDSTPLELPSEEPKNRRKTTKVSPTNEAQKSSYSTTNPPNTVAEAKTDNPSDLQGESSSTAKPNAPSTLVKASVSSTSTVKPNIKSTSTVKPNIVSTKSKASVPSTTVKPTSTNPDKNNPSQSPRKVNYSPTKNPDEVSSTSEVNMNDKPTTPSPTVVGSTPAPTSFNPSGITSTSPPTSDEISNTNTSNTQPEALGLQDPPFDDITTKNTLIDVSTHQKPGTYSNMTDTNGEFLNKLISKFRNYGVTNVHLVYISVGVFLFINALISVAIMCHNPREPRSRQEDACCNPVQKNRSAIFFTIFSVFMFTAESLQGAMHHLLASAHTTNGFSLTGKNFNGVSAFWGLFCIVRLSLVMISGCLHIKPGKILFVSTFLTAVGTVLFCIGTFDEEDFLWSGIIIVAIGLAPILPTSFLWMSHYMKVTHRMCALMTILSSFGSSFTHMGLAHVLATSHLYSYILVSISSFSLILLCLSFVLISFLEHSKSLAVPLGYQLASQEEYENHELTGSTEEQINFSERLTEMEEAGQSLLID